MLKFLFRASLKCNLHFTTANISKCSFLGNKSYNENQNYI